MTTNAEELLPCPFCGEQPKITTYPDGWNHVHCSSEKCFINPETRFCPDQISAIEAWNTRILQEENQ